MPLLASCLAASNMRLGGFRGVRKAPEFFLLFLLMRDSILPLRVNQLRNRVRLAPLSRNSYEFLLYE